MRKSAQAPQATPGLTGLGTRTASGIALSLLQSVFGRFVILVSQLILARILAPEDFGVLGLATTVSAIFGILTGFGIEQVLQQRRQALKAWATQAFWISLLLSVLAGLAMCAYAPVAAKLYHNDKITALILVSALSLPFTALCTVPMVRLKAEFRFSFLAVVTSFELLLGQGAAILLAWQGFGAISFVLATPFIAALKATVFWWVAPVQLRSWRAVWGWGRMIRRGGQAFAGSILNIAIGQGDYVILGLTASAEAVGAYFFAFRLSVMPIRMLASNFVWALRPALIALGNDKQRQVNAAVKTAKLLGLVTVPICFLQAAVAEPGIKLLFGNRWDAAIPIIQILSLALPIDAPSWVAGCFLEARGYFAKAFWYQLLTVPIFFLFVGFGAHIAAAKGVAIGVASYYVLHPIIFTALVFRGEGLPGRQIALSFFCIPVVLALIACGLGYSIFQAPLFQGHYVLQIVGPIAVSGCLYITMIKKLMPDIYSEVCAKICDIAKRR